MYSNFKRVLQHVFMPPNLFWKSSRKKKVGASGCCAQVCCIHGVPHNDTNTGTWERLQLFNHLNLSLCGHVVKSLSLGAPAEGRTL